jgi:peptide-methionine (R)-S-oxide reductase
MQRRHFLSRAILGLAATSVLRSAAAATAASPSISSKTAAAAAAAAGASGPIKIEKIVKTEEEWKKVLTPEQFYILRKEGTERPFSSPLNNEKRKGTFVCAACDLPLFESSTKFDSGTGWPSFYRAIDGRVEIAVDYKLIYPRTEYHCARCGGHHGHVFDDGPKPTGLRYCNNGVVLKFVPA